MSQKNKYQVNYPTLVALPSPDDYYDKIYEISPKENLNKQLPSSLDYRSELLPVRNQETDGVCVGLAGACIKEWQEKQDINFNEYMSGQFLYNLRSSGHQAMTGMDLMKILKKYGIIPEKYYPSGKKETLKQMSRQHLVRAKQFRIESYAKVVSIVGLKRALIENGPAFISMPVFEFHNEHFWRPIKSHQLRIGGQALVVVGYNKKGFWLRNSWGDKWAQKGYTLYPYSDWGMHWDIWTLEDQKTNFRSLSIDPLYNFDFGSNESSDKPELEYVFEETNDHLESSITISVSENQEGDCPTCAEEDEKNGPKKVTFAIQ